MKRIFAIVVGYLFLQTGIAQKTEFSMGVGGTASFFRGPNSASSSSIFISDVPPVLITNNAYGNHPGISCGAEATIQHLSRRKFLTGLSVGYESTNSRAKITKVFVIFRSPIDADGTAKLKHTFINLFPFIGKRFGNNKTSIDVNLGTDIGIPLSNHEKGEARSNDGTIDKYRLNYKNPTIIDLRPRLQLKLSQNHIGIQGSFSLGLTNYYGSEFSAEYKAYSNVFRLGVFYVL